MGVRPFPVYDPMAPESVLAPRTGGPGGLGRELRRICAQNFHPPTHVTENGQRDVGRILSQGCRRWSPESKV